MSVGPTEQTPWFAVVSAVTVQEPCGSGVIAAPPEPPVAESAASDPAQIVRDHFATGGGTGEELLDKLDKLPRKTRNQFIAENGLSPGFADENADLGKLFDKFGPQAANLMLARVCAAMAGGDEESYLPGVVSGE